MSLIGDKKKPILGLKRKDLAMPRAIRLKI